MNGEKIKYQFWALSYYDCKSLEENLTAMAANGWQLESLGGFFLKFKKMESINKKYVVFYSNDMPKVDYLQKVARWRQVQIFDVKEDQAIKLKVDDDIRLKNIRKTMRKSFLPSYVIIIISMLLIALREGTTYFSNSQLREEGTPWLFIISLYAVIIITFELLIYLIWARKSKESIANGGGIIGIRWQRTLQNIMRVGFFIVAILSFIIK